MKDPTERLISVPVSFGEKGTVYGCGHALDTFLYAYGLTTEDSLLEYVNDRLYEDLAQTLEQYDWDGYALAKLNETHPEGERAEAIASSEYLHGDWLRFNDPAEFAKVKRSLKEKTSALAIENINEWEGEDIPADLIEELRRSAEFCESYAHDQWLNGDRQNKGALDSLAIEMFGTYSETDTEWDRAEDTVWLGATEEQWREFYGYDLDERDTLPEPSAIAEYVRGAVLYKAHARKAKKDAERIKRAEAYKEAEELRTAVLEAQKEEARQRKIKKSQA